MERGPQTSKDINPATAFAIVAAILVLIGLTWFFVRPQPAEPVPAAPTSPDFSLTDEEAIARFKELDALRLAIYEGRDLSLVAEVFSPDSPIRKKVIDEVTSLRTRGVLSRTDFVTQSVEVRATGDERIVLRQQVEVYPRFESESGRDLTLNARDELQTIDWVLRRAGTEWLIFNGTVVDVETI